MNILTVIPSKTDAHVGVVLIVRGTKLAMIVNIIKRSYAWLTESPDSDNSTISYILFRRLCGLSN